MNCDYRAAGESKFKCRDGTSRFSWTNPPLEANCPTDAHNAAHNASNAPSLSYSSPLFLAERRLRASAADPSSILLSSSIMPHHARAMPISIPATAVWSHCRCTTPPPPRLTVPFPLGPVSSFPRPTRPRRTLAPSLPGISTTRVIVPRCTVRREI